MTRKEKIKQAVLIAVAYHIEEGKVEAIKAENGNPISWGRTAVQVTMAKTKVIQKRGRSIK